LSAERSLMQTAAKVRNPPLVSGVANGPDRIFEQPAANDGFELLTHVFSDQQQRGPFLCAFSEGQFGVIFGS